jgi:hypothetical protein
VFPDTDAISPRTRTCPVAGGEVDVVAGDDAELEVLVADPGLEVCEEPHAATETAVIPVTASIANRVSREARELAVINVSPIVGLHERVYRIQLCATCVKSLTTAL